MERAVATATKEGSPRFKRIKQELMAAPVHLCPERAYLITDYFRHHDNSREPMIVRRARALHHLLRHKSVHIYPDELIVGNMGSYRKSALMQPELASVFMGTDLLWIDRRKTTPLKMPWRDRLRLLFRVFPYWLVRNMPIRAFWPRIREFLAYALGQLSPTYYLINEAGGIGHFLPNYERMLRLGVKGHLEAMADQERNLHRAARIACAGLVDIAERFAQEADRLAAGEKHPQRAAELKEIARICRKVPYEPAQTFHEALQSLWLTHMAVNLEGLNSAVSFGRMDQYLYPYYRRDLDEGRLTLSKRANFSSASPRRPPSMSSCSPKS